MDELYCEVTIRYYPRREVEFEQQPPSDAAVAAAVHNALGSFSPMELLAQSDAGAGVCEKICAPGLGY